MEFQSTIERLGRQLERTLWFEAAYLAVRCLSHGWSREDFIARAGDEAKLPWQPRAAQVALEIISAIELCEGAEVSQLDGHTRLRYRRQLTAAILIQDGTDRVDLGEVVAALRELRQVA